MSISTTESFQSVRMLDAINKSGDAIARAQSTTYAARQAIKAIRCISEREVAEILACVQARISESGWGHTDDAVAADEALTDCIWNLETLAERSES